MTLIYKRLATNSTCSKTHIAHEDHVETMPFHQTQEEMVSTLLDPTRTLGLPFEMIEKIASFLPLADAMIFCFMTRKEWRSEFQTHAKPYTKNLDLIKFLFERKSAFDPFYQHMLNTGLPDQLQPIHQRLTSIFQEAPFSWDSGDMPLPSCLTNITCSLAILNPPTGPHYVGTLRINPNTYQCGIIIRHNPSNPVVLGREKNLTYTEISQHPNSSFRHIHGVDDSNSVLRKSDDLLTVTMHREGSSISNYPVQLDEKHDLIYCKPYTATTVSKDGTKTTCGLIQPKAAAGSDPEKITVIKNHPRARNHPKELDYKNNLSYLKDPMDPYPSKETYLGVNYNPKDQEMMDSKNITYIIENLGCDIKKLHPVNIYASCKITTSKGVTLTIYGNAFTTTYFPINISKDGDYARCQKVTMSLSSKDGVTTSYSHLALGDGLKIKKSQTKITVTYPNGTKAIISPVNISAEKEIVADKSTQLTLEFEGGEKEKHPLAFDKTTCTDFHHKMTQGAYTSGGTFVMNEKALKPILR